MHIWNYKTMQQHIIIKIYYNIPSYKGQQPKFCILLHSSWYNIVRWFIINNKKSYLIIYLSWRSSSRYTGENSGAKARTSCRQQRTTSPVSSQMSAVIRNPDRSPPRMTAVPPSLPACTAIREQPRLQIWIFCSTTCKMIFTR